MDLEKYKKLIEMAVSAKESRENAKEKKSLEEFEINLRKGFREQELMVKLHDLYDNKQFIGYICVASQYIEFSVKRIILQFQQLATSLNKKFPNKDWERETLGGLITILENHCINDFTLIKQLRNFNNLRIKTIHKLFDIGFEIKDIEEEIGLKLNPSSYSYYSNIIILREYFRETINRNIEIKYKSDQMPERAKMFIDKLNEEIEREHSNFKKENIIKNMKI